MEQTWYFYVIIAIYLSKYSYWISAYKNGNYCLILLKLIFFLIFFLATKKDCILHSYLCIVKTKIVKVEDISPNLLGCFAEITAYLV